MAEVKRCLVCSGKKTIRIPVGMELSGAGFGENDPVPLDISGSSEQLQIRQREYPCPECTKVSGWRPIDTAPTDEMFIWAAPNGPGKWSVGLAYRNVSGGWSDAYGNSEAPRKATLWAPLPEPPQ